MELRVIASDQPKMAPRNYSEALWRQRSLQTHRAEVRKELRVHFPDDLAARDQEMEAVDQYAAAHRSDRRAIVATPNYQDDIADQFGAPSNVEYLRGEMQQ